MDYSCPLVMDIHRLIPGSALLVLIGVGTIAALVVAPTWGTTPDTLEQWTATPVRLTAVWPTATPQPAASPSPSRTQRPTLTPTSTSTASPTDTAEPFPSATPEPLPTPTEIATLTRPPTTTPTATLTPLPTPDGEIRTARVPILMYHHIAWPPPGADAVRRDLSLPPESLEEQLQYLLGQGYTFVTLSDLIQHLSRGIPLPSQPILLTFDDGYRDNYTHAFPLLKAHGASATFFLITGLIDQGHPEYLTWAQVEEMHSEGMQFGSHSYTHPDLRGKPTDYLVWQILGSKEAIESRLQDPVRFFSYPSGMYDDGAIAVLRSAHYWGAVTVTQGTYQSSEQPFQLQRIRIRGNETVASLEAKLAADW